MNATMLRTGRVWVILGLAGTMGAVSIGQAGEAAALQGAQAVMAILTEASGEARTQPAATAADPRQQFAAELASFTSNSAAMKPEEAANAWLGLVDRFWTLPPASGDDYSQSFSMRMGVRYNRPGQGGPSLAQVYAAIPGPAAWPLLQERAVARPADDKTRIREAGLRCFTLLLNRNWSGAAATIDEAIKALPKDDNGMSMYAREQFVQARRTVERLAKSQKAAGTAAEFERLLDALKDVPAEEVQIVIPDLAGIVGAQEAASLIERAVLIPNVQIEVKAGRETRQLVKAAVLRNLDKITRPQWNLVRGRDAVEYYEAMIKRFPPGKESDTAQDENFVSESFVRVRHSYLSSNPYERKAANVCYVRGLLAAGRQDDALRFATEEDVDLSDMVQRHGERDDLELRPLQVFQFAKALLERKPDARMWDALIAAGMEAGRDDEVLKAMTAPRSPLSDPERQAARESSIAIGYLALDRIDDGIALLRKLATGKDTTDADPATRNIDHLRQGAIQKMVTIGCLLDRQDLVDEGVAATLKKIRASAERTDRAEYMNNGEYSGMIDELTEAGRYRQAEDLTLELLRMAVRPPEAKRGRSYGADTRGMQLLASLARIYGAAGRPADVVALLEKAPWWGSDDLLRVADLGGRSEGRAPLRAVAAAALLAEGRTNEARRVAETHLMLHPGDDMGYEVLLAAGSPDLIERLDALYARDRFEERPLIWKAVCRFKAGQLESAEQTIREAIKVDPTDGETPPGNRVRAYAVLADILEARGSKDDAALFRNVVAAVRLAEKGDGLTEAGLLRRSVPLYDKAAALFSDAYCVQWRLAERLYATGHPQEAEKHYAIVFERMPEQFGQVASLCFGCEGVFDRSESRNVAERILARLSTNGTVRPQVFFLLGQLREAQGRYQEAYTAFRRAVNIDPGYLDAWCQIAEIAEEVALPQSDRDDIYLRMLRLDPLGAHASVNFARIADPKGVWDVVASHQKLAWAPPDSLLPLPASKAALDRKRTAALGAGISASELDMMNSSYSFYEFDRRRLPSPGEAVVSCSIIAETVEAFVSAARMR